MAVFLAVGTQREWWLNVTNTPEIRSINVFRSGICNGFKMLIPNGGQTPPRSTFGAMLAWKKAQKNAKKNITSETINSITPSSTLLEQRLYDNQDELIL